MRAQCCQSTIKFYETPHRTPHTQGHTQGHRDTHTQTHSDAQTHTQTQTHTTYRDTHTGTQRRTDTQTHRHTHTDTDRRTQTHTQTHRDTLLVCFASWFSSCTHIGWLVIALTVRIVQLIDCAHSAGLAVFQDFCLQTSLHTCVPTLIVSRPPDMACNLF